MKKLITISLFIFFSVTTAILIAGLVFYDDNKNNNLGGNGPALINPGEQFTGQSQNGQLILNASEAAKHNSSSDCWLIINGKIYNVTGFLPSHPGGADAITPYCGADASAAFATKGGTGSHSGQAVKILANYYIGDLNQTISQQQILEKVKNTNSVLPPTPVGQKEAENEGGDELDD